MGNSGFYVIISIRKSSRLLVYAHRCNSFHRDSYLSRVSSQSTGAGPMLQRTAVVGVTLSLCCRGKCHAFD